MQNGWRSARSAICTFPVVAVEVSRWLEERDQSGGRCGGAVCGNRPVVRVLAHDAVQLLGQVISLDAVGDAVPGSMIAESMMHMSLLFEVPFEGCVEERHARSRELHDGGQSALYHCPVGRGQEVMQFWYPSSDVQAREVR